ncbi:MAG: MATE family efflux transporter, partial [Lachnospiraceae bacterium]|nr:MATE family efflux transporter [Lachnospiraceae bacterium]
MERNLTEGNMVKTIATFSLPFLLSYFLQTLYGMADLFITGQYNGSDMITAVSVGSQIMHMVTVMIVGLAMGGTIMIGRYVGAKDDRSLKRTIGNMIVLFMGLSVVLAVVLLLFTGPITSILQTPIEAVDGTIRYLQICFIGIPFITAYNVISAIFRGMGDSKSPMYFIAIACIFNIALDYLFIGGMQMGSAGAALATILAQALSVLIALCSIRKLHLGIRLQKEDFHPEQKTMKDMLSIGLPVCAQDGFIQVSFLIITMIANMRGVDMAAAVGIVEKIITFIFLIPSSALSTVSAIAAQNIGAGKPERAREALRDTALMAFGIGLIIALLTQVLGGALVSLFTTDTYVAMLGAQYFSTYVFDCAFAGIHFVFSGYFSACDKSIISFLHNVISILVIRIPMAYLAMIC